MKSERRGNPHAHKEHSGLSRYAGHKKMCRDQGLRLLKLCSLLGALHCRGPCCIGEPKQDHVFFDALACGCQL